MSDGFSLYFENLKEFLGARGFCIQSNAILPFFLSEGFDFLSWNVSRKTFHYPCIAVNQENIKEYKRKIKIMVKSSYNKDIVSIVKLLNHEIQDWIKLHIFSSNLKDLAVELDFYIYKVLWRYVRRCHPRRSNTWIYSKYWKRFSGVWKFFVFNSALDEILFLKSHMITLLNNSHRIPSSLNAFNGFNLKKSIDSLSKKNSFCFSNGFNILYRKQKGLCVICKKPLWLKNCKLLKSNTIRSGIFDFSQDFYLIHIYCKYYY